MTRSPMVRTGGGWVGTPVSSWYWGAFALRLTFLLGSGRYVDEYITILAARAVNQWGYPRLPSGMFYTHVLPLIPLYALVVGRELDFISRAIRWRWGPEVVVGGCVVALMAPSAFGIAASDLSVLDCAWSYVKTHWREGDAVATIMPAVAYGWLGRMDYFAMERGYEAVETGDGLVDIWIGAPLVDSPGEMQAAIDAHPRLWFVLDERGWDWFYSDDYRAVVNREMDLISVCPGMRVYVTRP